MTAHTPSTDTLMSDTIKILLVDDDRNEEVILRRIASKVTTHTIELHYSETIAEALAFIRESNDIRLVLMDNRLMPTVDFRESVPACVRQASSGRSGSSRHRSTIPISRPSRIMASISGSTNQSSIRLRWNFSCGNM